VLILRAALSSAVVAGLLRQKWMRNAMVAGLALVTAQYGILTWLMLYLRDHAHIPLTRGGWFLFLAQAAGAECYESRIPSAVRYRAACAKQGYRETAVVLDADGATIVALRGDGAGIHTLDSAHDKAYTSVSFKNDTIALEERGKGEIAPLSKLPHVMFFGGGVVIKLGDEIIGAIGASGAPGGKLDDNCAHAGLEKIRDRLN
jgi:uncharacterized protein GlcG (DUF336 family)